MSPKSNPSKSTKKRMDDKQNDSSGLPGWPGYRTRAGRSGLDPLDTRAEAGHIAGNIFRNLFTGQIRNRFHLSLLGALGLTLIAPLVLAISETWKGTLFPWNAWVILMITGIAGLAILINVVRNLVGIFLR